MKRTILGAAALAAMVVAAPAFAAVSVEDDCSADLTVTAGSSVDGCAGRITGNALTNASNGDLNAALFRLGYDGPAVAYESLPDSAVLGSPSGMHTVRFPGMLNGTVYLAVHYDEGKGGPGGSTTIYKIAASDLGRITLNQGAGANAVVLAAVPGRLPESATWAMLLLGFGAVGFALRTAKSRADAKFELKIKRIAAGESD